MKNTIRCCISCILPCGALDVIRIVHVNGRVEEITGTIYAAEILKDHPRHILKKPTTKPISEDFIESTSDQHQPTIVVVPPDAQLQRGKIYFLIPDGKKTHKSLSKSAQQSTTCKASRKRNLKEDHYQHLKQVGRSGSNNNNNNGNSNNNNNNNNNSNNFNNGVIMSLSNKDDDKYLSEILSEKVSSQRERRRGRVAVWRPHLESITETFSDASSNDR